MTEVPPVQSSLHTELNELRRRVEELEAEVAGLESTRRRLREQYSFRQGVIERAAEGICVCHAVQEHPFVRFTVWNGRMKGITGYSMDDINRLGWYQTMYPDSQIQERARQRMAQMRGGMDLRNEHWDVIRADGEKRVFGISSSLLTTDDGLTHALALMLDVTETVRKRQHLEGRLAKLEGILPICASCKKIRDEAGAWQMLESYISNRSDARFSHGMCPHCAEKWLSDLKR